MKSNRETASASGSDTRTGATGEVDLSDVAGRGVFATWNEPGFFDKVHIAPHRSIAWNDEIELCPDALYMEVTGKSLSELPPATDAEVVAHDA